MSALLAEVEKSGERMADAVVSRGRRRATLVGASGAGKSAALRHASDVLGDDVIVLEAADDNLAPTSVLEGLTAGLTASDHRPPATDDAEREAWEDRILSCIRALEVAGEDAPVVLLSDADRLERVRERGGTPGRHAAEVIDLFDRHVQRVGVSRAAPLDVGVRSLVLETQDLRDWLLEREAWAGLAPAAATVAERGTAWSGLPALTLRLVVGLAHLDALPAFPPPTPTDAARLLACELAARRSGRLVWTAWQLVAGLRGPLDDQALDILLADLPAGVRDDVLLNRCLLFADDGWRMHPILREVARRPPEIAASRMLPALVLADAGGRMFEHFRREADSLMATDRLAAAAAAHLMALDACAMAGDDALVERLDGAMPDPYDHVGDRLARSPVLDREPSRSLPAYERARDVDGRDATALRGIAAAEDRDGTDAVKVEQLLRQVLEFEPQDVDSHVRLIGVFLAVGRPEAAGVAFDHAARTLAGMLDEHDLAEQLYVPVSRTAVAAGQLSLASRAAVAAHGALRVREAQELDRLVEGLVETLEYGEFVAPHRLGGAWWMRPEALAEFDSGRRPLSRWLAARVDAVDDAGVAIHYADVVLPVASDRRPERAWTTIACADLRRLCLDELPPQLPGTILEIGVYGDGEQDGSTVIRVVRAELASLPEPTLPLGRYVHQLT